MYDLAISVAGPFRHLAGVLAILLSRVNVRVFLDEFEQLPVDSPGDLIERVFRNSRFNLLIDTPEYGHSRWTEAELSFLLDRPNTVLYSPAVRLFDYVRRRNNRVWSLLLESCLGRLGAKTDLLRTYQLGCDRRGLLPGLFAVNSELAGNQFVPPLWIFMAVLRSFVSHARHPGCIDYRDGWTDIPIRPRRHSVNDVPVTVIVDRLAGDHGQRPQFNLDALEALAKNDLAVWPTETIAHMYLAITHPKRTKSLPSRSLDAAREHIWACETNLTRMMNDEVEAYETLDPHGLLRRYMESIHVAGKQTPWLKHDPRFLALATSSITADREMRPEWQRVREYLVSHIGRLKDACDHAKIEMRRTQQLWRMFESLDTPKALFEAIEKQYIV